MEAIFRRVGKTIHYTPSGDISAGDVALVGTVPGVAERAISSGVEGDLTVEGIFQVLKDSSTFTAGDAVYWDEDGTYVGGSGTGAATSTASYGNLMGFAEEDAATGDETVLVKLTCAKRTATIAGSVTANDITGSDSSLGIAGQAAAQGGAIAIAGGTSSTAAYHGGAITIAGGTPGLTGNGGAMTVTGGIGGATSGNGGAVTLAGGAGTNGNGDGGAVTINGGAKNGSGADGAITIGSTAASVTLGKMPRLPINANVAVGGTAIGNANAVLEGITRVSGADDTAAVILPTAVAGMQVILVGTTAAKKLAVFPAVGAAIGNLGANNVYTASVNASTIHFLAVSTTLWYVVSEINSLGQ